MDYKLNGLFLNYHSKSSCTLKIEMVQKYIFRLGNKS